MILKNKNILITGAGKGIGESTIHSLVANGAFVYALIKDKKDNKKFKGIKNLKIYNGKVENKKLIIRILNDSKKKNRLINGLVNNAGIRFRKNFLKIKRKELNKIFEVNFFSIFSTMQVFSDFLIKNKIKGSIVNLASIVGQIGFEELSAYASTKGALISLTKSFATEMSKHGIRANTISPGFTKTSFYKNFKKNKKQLYSWTLSRIPMKRWGEPTEISDLIAFILSEKSSYLNAENINVDGGWLNS
tara:strand:- start:297 stop:1037 length:741 start_codon:yes stop_codon:yes gene_type:complete